MDRESVERVEREQERKRERDNENEQNIRTRKKKEKKTFLSPSLSHFLVGDQVDSLVAAISLLCSQLASAFCFGGIYFRREEER